MRRMIVLMLLWVGLAGLAAPPVDIATAMANLQKDPALAGAKIGILIQSLDEDRVWYAKREGETFIPASTAKIVTAALALEYLDVDFHFSTTVLADGPIVDGVLQGNLILKGGGDPALTAQSLRDLAGLLARGEGIEAPIRAIQGRILLDNSFFANAHPLRGLGWEADDLPWYYAAPPSALACNGNAVRVTVRGTQAGKAPSVTLDPPTSIFTVVNRARTGAPTARTPFDLEPGKGMIRLTGRIAPGVEKTERVSVQAPERFVLEQWGKALKAAGITVQGGTPVAAERRTLLTRPSAPLGDIIGPMLKESDNHTAEQVRMTLLALYSLEPPLETRYPIMLTSYCALSDIVMGNFLLVDGSGLSRKDQMSPRGAVRILTHMAGAPQFQAFYDALPVAGCDGTLKSRMCSTAATGNAHAKTGTMTGVSTLAGYVTTQGGEHLAFAVFLNGYRGKSTAARRLQDAVVCYLATAQ